MFRKVVKSHSCREAVSESYGSPKRRQPGCQLEFSPGDSMRSVTSAYHGTPYRAPHRTLIVRVFFTTLPSSSFDNSLSFLLYKFNDPAMVNFAATRKFLYESTGRPLGVVRLNFHFLLSFPGGEGWVLSESYDSDESP